MGGGVNGKLAGNSKKAAGRTNGSACAFDHQIELFPTSRYEEILLIISNSTAKSMHQCEGDDRRKIHRVSYRKLRCVPLETMMENRTVGEKKSIDGNMEETRRRLMKVKERKLRSLIMRSVWRDEDKMKMRWGKTEETLHKNSNTCPKCMGIVLVIGIALLSVIAVNENGLMNLLDEMGQRPIKKIRVQLKNGNIRMDMNYRHDTGVAILSVIVVNESELVNLSDEMGQRLRKKINMQLKNGNKRLNMKYEYDIKYRIKTVSKKNVSLYWNKRDNRMISKEKLWLYMKEALGWILVQKQRK